MLDRDARSDPEEERLVAGLQQGETWAIQDFLSRTHQPVFAMACRISADADLRQDWTHDVLLKIIEELGRGLFVYRWPGCFWSWFRKRAHFLLLNCHQAQKKQRMRELGESDGDLDLGDFPMSTVTDSFAEFRSIRIRAAIEDCISRIKREESQKALFLRIFEELSYEEIAAELSVPLNTVRTWIRRCRMDVRTCLMKRHKIDKPEAFDS